MFCPHCHNKIPDGSNICPLCYANLAGVKPERSEAEPKGLVRSGAGAGTRGKHTAIGQTLRQAQGDRAI